VRHAAFIALIAINLTGCGSSTATTPTTLPTSKYKDPVLHFSFVIPSAWKIGKNATRTDLQPIKTYVVSITTPGSQEGVEFTVDQQIQDYSKIPEGKVVPAPGGGPDTLQYHHLVVAGWPALQVKRFSGQQIDSYDTIINTHDHSYDLKMATGTPPFPPSAVDSYNALLRTLQLPF
jgi:hypothetical protein